MSVIDKKKKKKKKEGNQGREERIAKKNVGRKGKI